MNTYHNNLAKIIQNLTTTQGECEWIEFKHNNAKPEEIGQYISALANSACLHSQPKAYLIYGIQDESYSVIGTSVDFKSLKVGNEELENWLNRLLFPKVDFKIEQLYVDDKQVVIFVIDSVSGQPVAFKHTEYIRVGTYKKKAKYLPFWA